MGRGTGQEAAESEILAWIASHQFGVVSRNKYLRFLRAAFQMAVDDRMPVMDGMEATRQIRKRCMDENHPKIIALTANIFADDPDTYIAAGMNYYLSKPVTMTALIGVLDKC